MHLFQREFHFQKTSTSCFYFYLLSKRVDVFLRNGLQCERNRESSNERERRIDIKIDINVHTCYYSPDPDGIAMRQRIRHTRVSEGVNAKKGEKNATVTR